MRVVTVSPSEPRPERLEFAVETLRAGGVVAFPTETFYGLAVDPFDPDAVARLNRVKGKGPSAPCLLLLAAATDVARVAAGVPPHFDELAKLYWPGPLTLIVPAAAGVPAATTGGLGTVAVRVPGLVLARRLAAAFGGPITGVSANRTGQPACRRAEDVASALGDEIDLILDGGATTGGAPSTIVDLSGAVPVVVRHGLVPVGALARFLPGLESR